MAIKEEALILSLEKKWAELKYEILEKDPAIYQKIRTLLKDKAHPDEDKFNALILEALSQEDQAGRQLNALHHVWGYFKNISTQEEKAEFEHKLHLWDLHQIKLIELKQVLYTLALKYKVDYLLNSSYFKNQI